MIASGPGRTATGIMIAASAAANNLVAISNATTSYCLTKSAAAAGVIRNNDFYGCGLLLTDAAGGCVLNSDGDANATTCNIADFLSAYGTAINNFSSDPKLVDFGGDAVYPSASSPAAIVTGGFDHTAASTHYHYDYFQYDRRTVFGVGAIEFDY